MSIQIIQKENLSIGYIFLMYRRTRKVTKQLSREVHGSGKHLQSYFMGQSAHSIFYRNTNSSGISQSKIFKLIYWEIDNKNINKKGRQEISSYQNLAHTSQFRNNLGKQIHSRAFLRQDYQQSNWNTFQNNWALKKLRSHSTAWRRCLCYNCHLLEAFKKTYLP